MFPSGFGERPVAVAYEQEAGGDCGQARLTELGAAWVGGAVAISLLLVLTTAAHTSYDPSGILGYVLHKLDLRLENNLAAGWSAMLLAITSAHAFDGYARERLRSRNAALGWALIALLLLALSADEMGSLHERVGLLGDNPWLPLLPFAVIMAGLLAQGLILLWRAEVGRSKVLYLLLGFVLLGSAALHEFIGDEIELTAAGSKAFRAAFEEGSELSGMLVVLQVVMRNTAGFTARGMGGEAAFEAGRQPRLLLVGCALLLALLLAHVTSLFMDYQQRGRLADWAAAVLFLAAALAACRAFFATGRSIGWHRWFICGLCVAALMAVVDLHPERRLDLGPLTANLRLLVLGGLGLAAWATWSLDPTVRSRWSHAVGGITLAMLAAASLLPLGLFGVYTVSQLVGLAVYLVAAEAASGSSGVVSGEPPRSSAPPARPRGSVGSPSSGRVSGSASMGGPGLEGSAITTPPHRHHGNARID